MVDNTDKLIYAYQTKARGILTAKELLDRLEYLSDLYKEHLLWAMPKSRSARIMDIACGFGNMLFFAKKQGYTNVEGCDADKKQVELARLLGLPAVEDEAFSYLALRSEPVDCIFIVDFLEHLRLPDCLRLLRKTRNRLVSGGVLIVRVPSADGPFGAHDRYNDPTHKCAFTANSIRHVLGLVGFGGIKVIEERPVQSAMLGRLRYCANRVILWSISQVLRFIGLGRPAVWSRSMWVVAYRQ
jgi:SAM-dependent methyltransferase